MNASGTIIDVDPVESARDGAGAAAGGFKSPLTAGAAPQPRRRTPRTPR